MTLKYKIIISIATLISVFFLGRITKKEKIVTETKIEKVRDEQAIAHAVEQERKNILSQKKEKRMIDTIKLPDGTIRMHEEIANERISEETSQISKNLSLLVNSHEVENTELKTARNNFSIELLMGKEKNEFLKTLPQDSIHFGGSLSYRIFDGTWIGLWGLYKDPNEQIYGISARQEF